MKIKKLLSLLRDYESRCELNDPIVDVCVSSTDGNSITWSANIASVCSDGIGAITLVPHEKLSYTDIPKCPHCGTNERVYAIGSGVQYCHKSECLSKYMEVEQ